MARLSTVTKTPCHRQTHKRELRHGPLTILQEGDKELETVLASLETTKRGLWLGSGFGVLGMNFSFRFGGGRRKSNINGSSGDDILHMFNVWRVIRHGDGARLRQMLNDMEKNEHKQDHSH